MNLVFWDETAALNGRSTAPNADRPLPPPPGPDRCCAISADRGREQIQE